MKWHERVLDQAGLAAAERMAGALGQGFYLAGGTALALRLGHRISLDLDFFSSENRLLGSDRLALFESLKTTGPVQVTEEKDMAYHLVVGNTSVSLFHYPYPRLRPTQEWRGISVAAVEDIAAMKISAIVGRGARKDFIDLYRACRVLGLAGALRAARRKFPDHRDFIVQSSRALVYFEDSEKEPMPKLLERFSWSAIRAYFEREVPKALKEYLS